MSKRPTVNLTDLTSEAAMPMSEAVQRVPLPAAPHQKAQETPHQAAEARTENLEALAFKVTKSFRRRFKQRATNADMKLNQLLFEALDAWEEKNGLKR